MTSVYDFYDPVVGISLLDPPFNGTGISAACLGLEVVAGLAVLLFCGWLDVEGRGLEVQAKLFSHSQQVLLEQNVVLLYGVSTVAVDGSVLRCG